MKESVAVGLLQFGFGLVVGGLGVFVGFRLLRRFMKLDAVSRPPGGNAAAHVFEGAALISLAILARDAVSAIFEAVDVMLYRESLTPALLGQLMLAASEHLLLTVGAGVLVFLIGVGVFNRLTPRVDEVAEVRAGHIGPAFLLGAVLVVLALLGAPGLHRALNGLIPLPALPADVIRPPS